MRCKRRRRSSQRLYRRTRWAPKSPRSELQGSFLSVETLYAPPSAQSMLDLRRNLEGYVGCTTSRHTNACTSQKPLLTCSVVGRGCGRVITYPQITSCSCLNVHLFIFTVLLGNSQFDHLNGNGYFPPTIPNTKLLNQCNPERMEYLKVCLLAKYFKIVSELHMLKLSL